MAHLHTNPKPPTSIPSTLIFLIPGNPGLLSYYVTFLSRLSSLLSPSASPFPQRYRVTGTPLANFSPSFTSSLASSPPLGLEEQVGYVERALLSAVQSCRMERSEEGKGKRKHEKVILIGHSVGSYILLEILRRHHAQRNTNDEFEIIGGILLFPTVTHLAESPSGLKFSVCLSKPVKSLV